MAGYTICVPSYGRAEICQAKTLSMLRRHQIAPERIQVFVANAEELAVYERALKPGFYGRLVVGVKGLVPQRQWIAEQFSDGTALVFCDDDIDALDLTLSDWFKDRTLDQFLQSAFQECRERQAWIWGIYPVYNPYFRKPRQELTDSLSYICGGFYGTINRPDFSAIRLTLTAEDSQKEDVERSIRYFLADGKVVRYNRIGLLTKCYGSVGGLGTFKARLAPMRAASERLKAAFPAMGSVRVRKNGMAEFRLRPMKAA